MKETQLKHIQDLLLIAKETDENRWTALINDFILPLLVGLIGIIIAIITTTGTAQIISGFSLGLYIITTILSYIIKKVISAKSTNQINKVLCMLKEDIKNQSLHS